MPATIDRCDPDWLKTLFGAFPSAIELSPVEQYFPQVAEWPQDFQFERPCEIISFPGETFGNWAEMDARLTAKGYGPERRTYPPHLARHIIPVCDALWKKCEHGNNPRWIHCSSSTSLWRFSNGNLYLPCVRLNPYYRGLSADYVGCGFDDFDGFVVFCE